MKNKPLISPKYLSTLRYFVFLLIISACSPSALSPSPTPTTSIPASITPPPLPTSTPTVSPSPSPTPFPVTDICTPLQDHELSRIVEYVSHPYTPPIGSNLETGHHGVDFSYYTKDGIGPPIDNNPIQSMLNGRVAGIGINRLPYGNMLVIETPFENLPLSIKELFGMQAGTSLYLLYAHMLEAPIFSIGDPVSCADLIGIVGNSGFSGNPHLHLESRVGPSGLDLPTMIFYETTATLAEQAAYTEWRVGDTFTKHDPTLFLNLAGEQ